MRKKLFTYGIVAVLGSTLLITQPGCTSIQASETIGAATSSLKQAEEKKEFITNGGFEDADLSAWNVSASDGIVSLSEKDVKEGAKVLHFWAEKGETFTVTQKIDSLPAGTYKLTAQSAGGDGETVSVIFNGQEGTDSQKDAGWCQYTQSRGIFTVKEDMKDVEVGVKVVAGDGAWGDIDCISLVAASKADLAAPAESSLYVEKINDLSEDFIRGFDISSLKAEYNSGVKYYDFDGKELPLHPEAGQKGIFDFFAESGVNWVRLRVWNDPYDADGNGYGGGTNDIKVASELGKLATDAGMKVLIDFHYSDFWADPERQLCPKAWKDMTVDQKAEALEKFTTESLNTLKEAGVNVNMVQVGNETTGGMSGEAGGDLSDSSTWAGVCKLMNAGSKAIRAFDKNILVAVHFTDPGVEGKYENFARILDDNKVDYDVFASSYYPNIHGSTENLTTVMKQIADKYGKKLLVAETAYPYTSVNGDEGGETSVTGSLDYKVSQQGQVNEVMDVVKAVKKMGDAGLGVMYWEPAWIPVNVVDWTKDDAQATLDLNKEIWNKYGSGWAAKYAAPYDKNSEWWGGSAQDNLAMFDFTGKALDTINVFKYMYTGTTAKLTIDEVADYTHNVIVSDDWNMPNVIPATYIDNSKKDVSVTWNSEQVEAAKKKGVGDYIIDGTVDVDSKTLNVKCNLNVKQANLLKNPGLEDGDSDWKFTGNGIEITKDSSNVRNGESCIKYWNAEATEYTAEQTVTLDKGIYELDAFTQGGDSGDGAVYQLFAKVGDKTYKVDTTVTKWQEWASPVVSEIVVPNDNTKVTIGVYMKVGAGAWGSWDDFYLKKTGDVTTKVVKAAKVKLKSVSAKKNSVIVKWNKASNADGYVVEYSTDKKFKNVKKITVKTAGKTQTKITTKKAGKKLYVRVCAYSKSSGKKVNGKYSAVKSIKTI